MKGPAHRCGDAPALKVCLVTREFHGLFKNGGIGTAMTSLAFALAAHGFEVTVVTPNADESGPRLQTGDFATLQAEYAKVGITLDYVKPHPHIDGSLDDSRTASYCTFLYLQHAGFDVVVFSDNGGLAYYSALAKRTGVFENAPSICVVAHGPLNWVNELNMTEFTGRGEIAIDHLERGGVRLADLLVSPSRYLLEWMRGRNWVLPARTEMIQNLVDVPAPASQGAAAAEQRQVRELVFFGRLETRKGVALFCDALDLLEQQTDISALTVTFLGKILRISGVHSGVYVLERARRWKAAVRILAGYDQKEALEYLGRPGTLAVIPSRAENSPCVVAECLQLGYLFLTSDSGGTAELIAAEDRAACLFAPEPAALASRMDEVLRSGHRPGRLAVPQSDSRARWIEALTPPRPRMSRPAARPPRVSACLVWSASQEFAACLASLTGQSYPNLEIVVVALADSAPPASLAAATPGDGAAPIPVHVCAPAVRSYAAARCEAARRASGDYLLFIDESSVTLRAEAVAAFAAAAAYTGADILTTMRSIGPLSRVARPAERRWAFPLGSCLELGTLENCFGEGALLVKSGRFRGLEGFAADCDTAVADWVFLTKALLGGASLELIPAPLLEMRARRGTLSGGGTTVQDHRRVLEACRNAPFSMVSQIFEALIDVPNENRLRTRQVLETLPATARELALQLSKLDPGSREAGRLFVQYCCERGALNLAIDFARCNDAAYLLETIDAARRVTEDVALDAVRTGRIDLWHTLDLAQVLTTKATAVSGVGATELERLAGGGLAYPAPVGSSVIRVGGACPPGTGGILLSASAEGGAGLSLAAVVHDAKLRHAISAEQLIAGGRAWSGWVAAAGTGAITELSIALNEPLPGLLDLSLLARRQGVAGAPAETVTWQRLEAAVRIADRPTSLANGAEPALQRLPKETLALGEVLTDMAGISMRIFQPGEQTLLHPLPNRLALVRIPGALPPRIRGLRCAVSLAHEKGHPVEFGVWIRPADAPARSAAELAEDASFSGWLQVAQPHKPRDLTMLLADPGDGEMDLYLATRVVGFPDANYCHALWHEFWIIR